MIWKQEKRRRLKGRGEKRGRQKGREERTEWKKEGGRDGSNIYVFWYRLHKFNDKNEHLT